MSSPSSPTAGTGGPAVLSVSALQENVDSVIEIMRTNVQKAMIRDHQLEELDKRASILSESASSFQLQARELRHVNLLVNNMRGLAILATPVLVFFAILWCESDLLL